MQKTKQVILMTVMFILFLPVFVMAGTVELPKTGQTTCYDTGGAGIDCVDPVTGVHTGQDGDIQAGVAWPNPRFTNNGDGTVTDNLTGLMWTQDGNAPGPVVCSPALTKTWQQALDYVACLNAHSYLGYTDWHLPNVSEYKSLINAGQGTTAVWLNGQGFNNVQSYYYWSSTSVAYYATLGWMVDLRAGFLSSGYKDTDFYYVWPVRFKHFNVSKVSKTGQTTCYNNSGIVITCTGTGQDGEIQAGVAWPSSRFSVGTGMENECVIDNLTGLMWSKNANNPDVVMNWQQALEYANGLSLCGYSDWRLPNQIEMYSLQDFSRHSPMLPSGHPFMIRVSYGHETSTTNTYSPYDAWGINMWYGFHGTTDKSMSIQRNVWPVRSARDLVVSALTAPLVSVPGQSILLSESTKNQGSATAGASTTKFYWRPSSPSPVLLGSRSVPALAPGEVSSGTTSVTIPSVTCSGMKTFYIKAAADADGVVTESDETNNSRLRAIKLGPDMTIPVLTAPWNAGAGKTINISDTTKNTGGCTGGASTTKFYLSVDYLWDSGDILLGSRAVPSLTSGGVSSGSTAVTIPAGTATGKYYIIAWSDADNVVAETFEGNNKKVRTINIVPDLIVSILSAPNTASAGATITISDTTKNIGGSTAAASATKFYLSTDTTFDTGDTLLGNRSIPSLTAGATNSGGTSVTIPTGTTSGAYYIIGRSDADAIVAETNESNNNKNRMITVP